MAQIVITINHREYAISCEDGTELQVMKMGRLLDEKAHALTNALGQINENLLLAMVGLLIADELSETKKELAANTENVVSKQPSSENEEKIKALEASLDVAKQKISELEQIAKEQANIDNNTQISDQILAIVDDNLSSQINSLTETIKSIALKLKSI